MAQVSGKYPDYTKLNSEKYFNLYSDQAFDPYRWQPPVNWEGKVDGKTVKFIQVNSSSLGLDDFNWGDFPDELNSAKSFIVEAIDEAMKVMD